MLLQSLLRAIATGVQAREREKLVEKVGRIPGVNGWDGRAIPPMADPKSVRIPPTRFDGRDLPGLIFDRPFQEIIAHLDAQETWSLFQALPPAEQLRLLEQELAALAPREQARVAGLLKRELSKPWLPLPGPQSAALRSEADILFYGGGAGSGKSSLLCGLSVTEHHRVRLFRRESVQVRGLVDEVGKILKSRDGYNSQANVWRLPGGAELEFAHCQHEDDKEKYQGRAADLIGFDEITHFSESQFRYLIGWNRSDHKRADGSQQRCRVVVTGNPPERADGRWVIGYFAPWLDPSHPNPAADGELRWYTTVDGVDHEVDGRGPHGVDDLGQPIYARSRTFIRGLLKDNPYLLETGYAATLQAHPEPLRSMLLMGRFDVAVKDDPWQVIPSEWIARAQDRWTQDPPAGKLMSCMGVDVAQGGSDETVLQARYGEWFAMPVALPGIDTKNGAAVGGLVFAHLRDGCEVAVDVGGGWGADAHGHMIGMRIRSTAVNWVESSGAVTQNGNLPFLNKRAEYWWRFREALDPNGAHRIALPPDKTLAVDLATPLWQRTPGGLIKVESKEEIRKRLGRSPDRGDAIVMSWQYGWMVEKEQRAGYLPSSAVVAHANVKRHGREMPQQRQTSKQRAQWR